MGNCEYPGCSGDSTLQNSCSYCGFEYCSRHRLPERHNCPALSETTSLGPDFRAEYGIETASGGQTLCTNCESSPVVFGEEYCEDCLDRFNSRSERKQCDKCSSYTVPGNDLCLECRRKEATMDSRSPDLLPDGTLEAEDSAQRKGDDNKGRPKGILQRVKALFNR